MGDWAIGPAGLESSAVARKKRHYNVKIRGNSFKRRKLTHQTLSHNRHLEVFDIVSIGLQEKVSSFETFAEAMVHQNRIIVLSNIW